MAVASAKSTADKAASVNSTQNVRLDALEKAPHVTREVSKAVSASAGSAVEATATAPTVAGYEPARLKYISCSNPRLLLSKWSVTSATLYNPTSTAQSGTVYFGIEYDIKR